MKGSARTRDVLILFVTHVMYIAKNVFTEYIVESNIHFNCHHRFGIFVQNPSTLRNPMRLILLFFDVIFFKIENKYCNLKYSLNIHNFLKMLRIATQGVPT